MGGGRHLAMNEHRYTPSLRAVTPVCFLKATVGLCEKGIPYRTAFLNFRVSVWINQIGTLTKGLDSPDPWPNDYTSPPV